MIIDLKRTLFPYAHALLMIDGGGSLVPDFQPGPPYLHAPVQLLVIKEIKFRHPAEFREIGGADHHGGTMGKGRLARLVELSLVDLSMPYIAITEGDWTHWRGACVL